jgi:4-alpha-glucanotransferase
MAKNRFKWWDARLAHNFALFDVIRLDHFIGFCRYWRIPASAKTAKSGTWQPAKPVEFFKHIQKSLPNAQFIAEDLGAVTPEIRRIRDDFGFAGMKLLQFSFGTDSESATHRPHNYPKSTAAYTGTHDNDTSLGFAKSLKGEERKRFASYVDQDRPVRDMISTVAQSAANLCIFPMQDLLELGSEHRMNVPGKPDGNWRWRLEPDLMNAKQLTWLKDLTVACDRT